MLSSFSWRSLKASPNLWKWTISRFPQEPDRVADVRILYNAKDIVVRGPRLLLRRQILEKIRERISLGLKLAGVEGNAARRLGPDPRGMIDIIRTQSPAVPAPPRKDCGSAGGQWRRSSPDAPAPQCLQKQRKCSNLSNMRTSVRFSVLRYIAFRPLRKSKNMMKLIMRKVPKSLILSRLAGTKRTINLYAIASAKFQIAVLNDYQTRLPLLWTSGSDFLAVNHTTDQMISIAV